MPFKRSTPPKRNIEIMRSPFPPLEPHHPSQIYAGVRTDNKRERPNKRSHDSENTSTESTNKKIRAEVTNINDVVCPWWAMPYDEQLAKKEAAMREECIAKIKSKLRSSFFEANDNRRRNKQTMLKMPDWLEKTAGASLSPSPGLVCSPLPLLQHPFHCIQFLPLQRLSAAIGTSVNSPLAMLPKTLSMILPQLSQRRAMRLQLPLRH
jgi:hypothetical protein